MYFTRLGGREREWERERVACCLYYIYIYVCYPRTLNYSLSHSLDYFLYLLIRLREIKYFINILLTLFAMRLSIGLRCFTTFCSLDRPNFMTLGIVVGILQFWVLEAFLLRLFFLEINRISSDILKKKRRNSWKIANFQKNRYLVLKNATSHIGFCMRGIIQTYWLNPHSFRYPQKSS